MRLFEHQAKEAFARQGIPVPASCLIHGELELADALTQVGLPCMLKAQVLTGGRGKAGLIKRATTQDNAEAFAAELFSRGVPSLLVEQAVEIASELYLSISVDPEKACAVLMGCAEGGVEIEEVARTHPAQIIREPIRLETGLEGFQVSDFVYRMGLREDAFRAVCAVVKQLFCIFVEQDAELVEINPLFIDKQGRVIAGDGKLIIDDSAMFRHPDSQPGRDHFQTDMEFEAAKEGIPYIQFDGDISLMCAGAGLANTVYDLIRYEGGSVANYLEFGGPNYTKSFQAMELCLANRSSVVLIVTFGTIARADVMARGIAEAIERLRPTRPIVTCIRGTGEEEAAQILAEAGLENKMDTEEAVREAVRLAREAAL